MIIGHDVVFRRRLPLAHAGASALLLCAPVFSRKRCSRFGADAAALLFYDECRADAMLKLRSRFAMWPVMMMALSISRRRHFRRLWRCARGRA